MFKIRFKDEVVQINQEFYEVGEIKIGDFTEYFHSPTSYWNKSDYLNQWREGLDRIKQRLGPSCFVTAMYDPADANFIIWWVMYVEGEWALIQNHILFLNEVAEPFQEANLYSSIPKREIYNEDGDKISEWKIRIEDIGNEVGH